ncbi:MAG: MlaD family protein [Solirubrobacteraceae bacterium]|nr:MlaD family protein [Solirubrobacteraceae bacterium]
MTRILRTTRLAWPILLLIAIGMASAAYVLVQQRFPLPFRDTYTVRALLTDAGGVAPGFGQAVNVVGVKVGTITEAEVEGDRTAVTLEIERKKLAAVHRDASVHLRPITPLKDMRVELDPGTPEAGPLEDGAMVDADRATSPVAIGELLSTLDADTRSFLTNLVGGSDEATKGRGPDLRRTLRAMGPTTAHVRRISARLDDRRRRLARLVTNIAAVTRAARSDGRLAELLGTGRDTLAAIADQEAALRTTMRELPDTLRTADRALAEAGRLSTTLTPTLRELNPTVADLPRTLRDVEPLTAAFADLSRREFRPLLRTAVPIADEATATIRRLSAILPDASRAVQALTYVLNTIGHNPNTRDDQGYLRWLAWAGHNFNTVVSTSDAHGAVSRALPVVHCSSPTYLLDLGPLLHLLTGTSDACPPAGGDVPAPASRDRSADTPEGDAKDRDAAGRAAARTRDGEEAGR